MCADTSLKDNKGLSHNLEREGRIDLKRRDDSRSGGQG